VSDPKNLYILGYSGHAYVVIDVAISMGISVMGYFDKTEVARNPYQIKYFGNEKASENFPLYENAFFFPAVGNNILRAKMVQIIRGNGLRETKLIHGTGVISSHAKVLESTLIAPGAVVNSGAVIGEGCIINSGAIIEHECAISDYTHIAPGAVLAGKVSVGQYCFIGAGAVVKQGVRIGENVVVGAGSVVLKDIPSGETWVGNPSKKLR
jgi:sugar O-acyltransferase (sialic acid O-acetyltransferase NeuD family)